MQRPRATVVYLGVSLASIVGYFTLGETIASFCDLMSALALVAVIVGLRRFHPTPVAHASLKASSAAT